MTAADRDLISQARILANLTYHEVQAGSVYADPAGALADVFGQAQSVLFALAQLAERLGGEAQ